MVFESAVEGESLELDGLIGQLVSSIRRISVANLLNADDEYFIEEFAEESIPTAILELLVPEKEEESTASVYSVSIQEQVRSVRVMMNANEQKNYR